MIHQTFQEAIYIPPRTRQLVLFLAPSDHLVAFCLCNHLNSFLDRDLQLLLISDPVLPPAKDIRPVLVTQTQMGLGIVSH